MATADRILMLKLLGDTGSIDKSLRKTEGRLKGMGRSALAWGKALTAGLVIEGIDKVTDALGEAWDGFREQQKASAVLGTTWRNLGLDGSKLSGTIDAISASALALGTDDVEAINAFNDALKTTGGDSRRAMDRLRIAQDLVANGSAPNLTSALRIIQGAAKGSARVVDRFGLKADDAAGRVKELGKKVRGAAKAKADMDPLGVLFNRMNEDLEGIVGSLASGELDDALTSLRDIGAALSDFGDKVGPGIQTVLDKLTDGGWTRFTDWLSTTFQPVVEDLTGVIDDMAYAWQNLQPIIGQVGDWMAPLFDLFSTTAAGGIGFVLDSVGGVLRTLGDLLTGDFSAAWESAADTVSRVGADVKTIIDGLATFLDKALGGIMDSAAAIGQGIFDGIAGAVGSLVRYIATTWNSLGRFGPGGFTFAEAFDVEIAGQHFGWPKLAIEWGGGDLIPNIAVPGGGGKKPQNFGMYEKGLWEVPDTMAAILHRGESVVPADFAAEMRANGGFGGGNTYNLNVNVAPGSDPLSTASAIVDAIKNYERHYGRNWRTA